MIIPEAMDEYIDIAAAELIPAFHAGRKEASILGRVKPSETAVAAYPMGTAHWGSRGSRILRTMNEWLYSCIGRHPQILDAQRLTVHQLL